MARVLRPIPSRSGAVGLGGAVIALLAVAAILLVGAAAPAIDSVVRAGAPPDTVPDDTVPPGTEPSTTAPDGTADPTDPATTAPDDTAPSDTTTDDTVPSDTTTDDTVPSDTAPSDTVAPEPVPPATSLLPPGPPPGFTEEQYRSFLDVVQACGFDAGWVCDRVFAVTGNETLAESAQWLYDVPVRIVIVLAVAFGLNRLVRRAIDRYAARVAGRTATEPGADAAAIRRDALRIRTAGGTIGRAATVVIAVIAALVVLAELGITLGPLLAGAGIAGIALGFGAQNLVRDFLAGIFVVFEDQYGVGDIIDAGRASGVVEEVTLRITKIRDVNGTLWFVPNGTIPEVGNMTQLWARAIIDFDIDYRADHERAGEIIKATADRLWRDETCEVRILEEPELWGVESLGDSAVVVRLAVKCAPAEQWKLGRILRGEVKKALDAEGIEIPFPQHTIWVHGDPETVAAATTGTIDADRRPAGRAAP